ncbi:MAG: hypothetical protein QW069_09240, partial [Candidatus Caldarchaeum sp.]
RMKTSPSICLLTALMLIGMLSVSAEVVSFRRSYGGSADDITTDIYVDSNGIYTVGFTSSFGPNTPNAFLTIFNSDNSHRCSVALDLGASEEARALTFHNNRIYMLGRTTSGPTPPNHFVAVFDTSCALQTINLYDIGPGEEATDIAVEPAASPSFYVVGYQPGIGAFVEKLDSSLNVVWAKNFRVRGGNDVANAVAFSGGRVYVAGTSDDGSSLEMFVSVFDTNGNHLATREIGGAGNDEAHDIIISGGNIYLAGKTVIAGRMDEAVLARLDSSLTLQWVRAFGTSTGDEIAYGLAAAGGTIYLAGYTTGYGTRDVLLAAFAPDGTFSHSFFITGGPTGDDQANAAASLGACVYPAGQHVNLPLFYVINDLQNAQSSSVSLTVEAPTPSTVTVSPSVPSPSPGVATFTPPIDTAGAINSFYSRFCPDNLVSTSTTTVTSTVGTTTTATATATTTTTAYAIATTTITQTSSVIFVSTATSTTTIPVTTTQTQTTTNTQTVTTTTTATTTSTILTTQTQSTTQTLTQITTVAFPEPVSTYILPMLLIMIAVLIATAIVVGRRRQPQPQQPTF